MELHGGDPCSRKVDGIRMILPKEVLDAWRKRCAEATDEELEAEMVAHGLSFAASALIAQMDHVSARQFLAHMQEHYKDKPS